MYDWTLGFVDWKQRGYSLVSLHGGMPQGKGDVSSHPQMGQVEFQMPVMLTSPPQSPQDL